MDTVGDLVTSSCKNSTVPNNNKVSCLSPIGYHPNGSAGEAVSLLLPLGHDEEEEPTRSSRQKALGLILPYCSDYE